MFRNIGRKIKGLATFNFWIFVIISVIFGFVFQGGILFFIIIPFGILLSWISSFVLYGYGELIEQTTIIAQNTVAVKENEHCVFDYFLNSDNSSYTVSFSNHFFGTSAEIPSIHNGLPVIAINLCMFYNSPVKTVNIPKSIKMIGREAFRGCEMLKEINYYGTRAEWDAIDKGDDWDKDSAEYTVHCIDD